MSECLSYPLCGNERNGLIMYKMLFCDVSYRRVIELGRQFVFYHGQ